MTNANSQKDILTICLTGAAGQIAYALIPYLLNGSIFGANKSIILRLLDITPMLGVLTGVVMEVEDCSYPNLSVIQMSDNPEEAFRDCDVAILVGAMPRREGMERKDLLRANAAIFKIQGEALDKVAKKTCKVLVVGNPANTNAFIVSHYAPSLPKCNFSALTRLDENRATFLLAQRLGKAVRNIIIWGNHSNTQYPDISHVKDLHGVTLDVRTSLGGEWYEEQFVKKIQTRGAAIIAARKLSSALSAAKAISDHLVYWLAGANKSNMNQQVLNLEISNDTFHSMAVISSGEYNVPEGLFYSFPVYCKDGQWSIVSGLTIDSYGKAMMKKTADELVAEREDAMEFLLNAC